MELNELFIKRRSMRSYDPEKKVSKEQIEELIQGTLMAPTWKNSETGKYYVAASPEKFKEALACLPAFNQKNAGNASALIVTSFVKDRSGFSKAGADNELGNHWGAYDLGLQNSYLVLKASDMGLDTLIMGLRDAEALRKVFDIPDNEEIVSVIALGYGTAEGVVHPRKNLADVLTIA